MTIFDIMKIKGLSRTDVQIHLDKESQQYGKELVDITDDPCMEIARQCAPNSMIGIWRSRDYFVQVFKQKKAIRISVNRVLINHDGTRWEDGITWDEMYRIKNEIGYEDYCAVELYPPKENLVDIANIRHMFVVNDHPSFMWR